MIATILLDIDGVVIKKRDRYSSEKFADAYNIPYEKIAPFFRNEFLQCEVGKADLKQELEKYVPTWGAPVSVDGFLDYWFSLERETVPAVMALIDELRKRGIRCSAVSDQEKYRADDMRNVVGLTNHFDDLFFSCDVGHMKTEPDFFRKVLEKLPGAAPEAIAYFDDDAKNIPVARQAGIAASYFYTDFETFKNDLRSLGIMI